jgi:drug/metabolite transporter (DMT)-like permease
MGRVAGIVALVALCWGGWPLVARMAGPTGATGSLVLVLASLAPISLLALLSRDALPSGAALGWLAAAGVLNGLGLVAFQALATDREVEVSRVVPVMDTAMLLVTAAGGMLFFAEALTPTKALGIGLLVAGIALLRPGS